VRSRDLKRDHFREVTKIVIMADMFADHFVSVNNMVKIAVVSELPTEDAHQSKGD